MVTFVPSSPVNAARDSQPGAALGAALAAALASVVAAASLLLSLEVLLPPQAASSMVAATPPMTSVAPRRRMDAVMDSPCPHGIDGESPRPMNANGLCPFDVNAVILSRPTVLLQPLSAFRSPAIHHNLIYDAAQIPCNVLHRGFPEDLSARVAVG
jgi:hypothetical protein